MKSEGVPEERRRAMGAAPVFLLCCKMWIHIASDIVRSLSEAAICMFKTKNQTARDAAHITLIPKTPFKFLWYVSKPHKYWLYAVLFVVVVASTLSQGSSYIFKLIVDAAEAGDTQKVVIYGLSYPAVIFLVQLLFRLSSVVGRRYVTAAAKTTSDRLLDYTLQHSHTYFIDRFAGSILTKFGNVMGGVAHMIPEFLWTILTGFVSFLVTFVLVATVDVKVALIFFGLVVFLIILNRRLAPKKQRLSLVHAESRSKLNGRTADVLSNISAARQYVRLSDENNKLRKLTTDRYTAHNATWAYSEWIRLINGVVLFIAASAMFGLLAMKWNQGQVSTGEFILVLSLMSQISYTLIFIGQAFNSMAESFGEMEEGLADLIVPYEITDKENASELVVENAAIEWKEVDFAFEKNAVFQAFDLSIQPGQRVGLVGPSGAGKTTFVSLLLRQHDIDGGEILIDEQNIAKVTQDSLREHIAVVPQEPLLFHRSIRENIAYGKPDATEEEIIEVAKKAQAHDFISALPEGYDTLVGERGVKLSGGQKQRVAIARAMLKDAPILILDEATSALDSESEVAIQKALHELMEGKTVIAVAHRLSTLREMDRIIVLDNGEITEDGDHDTLAVAGGTYQRLWEHQAGGFLSE